MLAAIYCFDGERCQSDLRAEVTTKDVIHYIRTHVRSSRGGARAIVRMFGVLAWSGAQTCFGQVMRLPISAKFLAKTGLTVFVYAK